MFAIIDFETTGLTDEKSTDFMRQPGIVQLGLKVLGSHFVETARLTTLVNPDQSAATWHEKAIETHGIRPEQVVDAPTYMALHPQFAAAVNGSKYWVGYRTRFDRDVLWYQLLRYGLERNFPWPPQEIDVLKLATNHANQKGKRGAKFLTLSDAYTEIVGKPMMDAHDAGGDVDATGELFEKIVLDGGLEF